jgi:hypothetical protein
MKGGSNLLGVPLERQRPKLVDPLPQLLLLCREVIQSAIRH